MIRNTKASDAQQIADIYNVFISTSLATFETERLSANDMLERMERVQANYPWLVYVEDDCVRGYAYATRWKQRKGYDLTAETSLYVAEGQQGKGIGTQLYSELIHLLNKSGIHTLIGGIALPNEPSVRLHESMGYRKVAEFEEVGWKMGEWINVGYWQLNFKENEWKQ